MDTLPSLQRELSALRSDYLAGPHSDDRDDDFANREAALGRRFRNIGETPSHPSPRPTQETAR